jgi:hypothetical protein
MSDGSVEDVRRYLRYLLTETGIEEQPWFWYAEAQVFAEPLEWHPLIGRRRRNDYTPWFDLFDDNKSKKGLGYDAYDKATQQDGVLSIVNELKEHFATAARPVIEPILGLFDFCDPSAAKRCERGCESYERKRNGIRDKRRLTPSFRYLPDPEESEEDKKKTQERYCAYVKNVRDSITAGESWKPNGKLIYPEKAFVLGLPLFVVESGSPRLLAVMILILEASEDDTNTHLRTIARFAANLQHRGAQELARRFHGVIDGFYPGTDPVTLVAHPAWTKEIFRSLLMLSDQDTHDGIKKYGLAGCDEHGRPLNLYPDRANGKHSDGLRFTRAFARAMEPFRQRFDLPSSPGDGDDFKKALLGFWNGQKDSYQQIKAVSDHIDYSDLVCDQVHRWLKSLYAHQPAQAGRVERPVAKYYLQAPMVYWLVALVAQAIDPDPQPPAKKPLNPRLEESFPCLFWPCYGNGVPCGTFAWPVVPGARFLIPWLAAARSLATMSLTPESAKEQPVVKAWVILKPDQNDGEDSFPSVGFQLVQRWVEVHAKGNGGSRKRCGLIVERAFCRDGKKWASRLAGWRRGLMDPGRHHGGDTGPLVDVLRCDCGSTLRARGLRVEGDSPIFRPLLDAGIVDLDLEYQLYEPDGIELLLAVSWEV